MKTSFVAQRKWMGLLLEKLALSGAAGTGGVKFGARPVLSKGDVLRIEPNSQRIEIECVTGKIWVTQGGSMEDIVLLAGERREMSGEQLVVAEALTSAELRVR